MNLVKTILVSVIAIFNYVYKFITVDFLKLFEWNKEIKNFGWINLYLLIGSIFYISFYGHPLLFLILILYCVFGFFCVCVTEDEKVVLTNWFFAITLVIVSLIIGLNHMIYRPDLERQTKDPGVHIQTINPDKTTIQIPTVTPIEASKPENVK